MKKINRQIKSIVFEMVILISFLFISFNIWDNFNFDEVAKIAYAYSTADNDLIVKLDSKVENILPCIDNEVNNNYNVNISIININNHSKEYGLYLKYDNNKNTFDKKYLKINYMGNVYYLNDFENYEKANFTYYKIDNNNINKKSKDEYDIKLYLDSNTPNGEINKNINITFVAEEI